MVLLPKIIISRHVDHHGPIRSLNDGCDYHDKKKDTNSCQESEKEASPIFEMGIIRSRRHGWEMEILDI